MTPKQEMFCKEYLVDLNATQAAIRAGYSAKNADKIGPELLGKTRVAAKIQELMDKRSNAVEINANTILAELLKLATVDISLAFDSSGGLLPLNEIPEGVRKAISGIEINELFEGSGDQKTAYGLAKKIKFWDKNKSLELLGKHLKLFSEQVHHTGKFTIEDLVAGSNDASTKKD